MFNQQSTESLDAYWERRTGRHCCKIDLVVFNELVIFFLDQQFDIWLVLVELKQEFVKQLFIAFGYNGIFRCELFESEWLIIHVSEVSEQFVYTSLHYMINTCGTPLPAYNLSKPLHVIKNEFKSQCESNLFLSLYSVIVG